MIILMHDNASGNDVEGVIIRAKELGLKPVPLYGEDQIMVVVTGEIDKIDPEHLESLPGVLQITRITSPFKFASRATKPEDTIVEVRGVKIGGAYVALIAGPCAVETEEQTMMTAEIVKKAGCRILRGGAFKPRTTPYSFQGLGEAGLKILSAAGDRYDMPVVTEVLDPRDVELVSQYTDIFQIGTRNMQNFRLLEEVGKMRKPVMLKRGLAGTIKEWLLAAEYILSNGNQDVILCERGIRTYEDMTRNTLDISAIPVVQELSHLPIIVDPSHATGKPNCIPSMVKAGIAAGANGIMVDVHPNPSAALCDGPQALLPDPFNKMMKEAQVIIKAIGKKVG
ncbi:3-deoxy-7-phosphoheptulonate synthase [Candidatus Peregrinibacteria bacterium]|nr:3-deoxy-7-phosphoheptulonate synthase [Candidatus Peregrinibacteria bacterium]